MVKLSDIIKKQVNAQKEKLAAQKEKTTEKTPPSAKISAPSRSSLRISETVKNKEISRKTLPYREAGLNQVRISEKIKEKISQNPKEKKEPFRVHLSGPIKEGDKERQKAYKEVEAKISAFRLAQIVREREQADESPGKFYEESLKKILVFWERLERKENLDFSPLKEIAALFHKALKNSPAILANLAKDYPADNYLPYHSLNVGLVAVALGLGLQWGGERLEDLALAALLHDIGMNEIPKEIYLKREFLKGNERIRINEHPKNSVQMIEKAGSFDENVTRIVFQHHERSNGQGYPQRLQEKDIHPGARIVGLADTFEAITHPRLYHKVRLPYDALSELIDQKKGEFDKIVLKALIQEITFYPLGSFVELNTGEVALVERTLVEYPTRPKVKVLISEGGEKLDPPREVNLHQERLLYIQRPISAPVGTEKSPAFPI